MTRQPITCPDCGVVFQPRPIGAMPKRCPDCARLAKGYRIGENGVLQHKPRPERCMDCGKSIEQTGGQPARKRCTACTAKRVKSKSQARNKARRSARPPGTSRQLFPQTAVYKVLRSDSFPEGVLIEPRVLEEHLNNRMFDLGDVLQHTLTGVRYVVAAKTHMLLRAGEQK